jgi:hypothetical protein
MEQKRGADWVARYLAIVSLCFTAAGVVFTYRNSEASRRQAELRAREVEVSLEVYAYLDLNSSPDDPILVVKLVNMGAPITVEEVAFDTGEHAADKARYTFWRFARPDDLNLPRRLDRNDALATTVRKGQLKKMDPVTRELVTGVLATTSTGQVFRSWGRSSDEVRKFLGTDRAADAGR